MYYWKNYGYYTENYGTLIYEGKNGTFRKNYESSIFCWKAMVTYQSIEVFKQLLLQNYDLLWKKYGAM